VSARGCLRRLLPVLHEASVVLLLGALPSCWTAALRTIPDTRSPYDKLPEAALERLAVARTDLEEGRAEPARSELAALAAEHPQNIAVGVWRQEAEIALETGNTAPAANAESLRERYRKRAEEEDTVVNLVLAARLEPDPLAAGVLLDRAEKKDPRCAWCSYGRAWLAARAGDWGEVRSRIARAKAADPGHMPTLWLETWMLARAGNLGEAIISLDTWIDKARGDPRLDPHLVLEAELDRALLAVLDGDPKGARKLLAPLDGARVDQGRRRMIEAGAEQELGDAPAALASAQEAERLRPDDILPVVQQALLHEMWLGDPRDSEADWTRALDLARADPKLSSLLERVRARVRLERFAAARETAARGAVGPGGIDAGRR
jgi:tetratricopeptide (TPR) repeat protein